MSSRSAARDLLLAQWNLCFAHHINVKAGHSISLAPAPRYHWHKTLKHVIPSNARDLLFTLWNHNRRAPSRTRRISEAFDSEATILG